MLSSSSQAVQVMTGLQTSARRSILRRVCTLAFEELAFEEFGRFLSGFNLPGFLGFHLGRRVATAFK